MSGKGCLRVAVIGWGRMGQAIDQIARERGHEIALRVDPAARGPELSDRLPEAWPPVDVALEFTAPAAAAGNVRALLEAGIPVVSGTTGWTDRLEPARQLARERGVGLLWAPNFALGVNLLFRLVEQAARALGAAGGFAPYVLEAHHDGKQDGPSGTARRLAELLVEHTPGKACYAAAPAEGRIPADTVPVAWIRSGHIPGEHRVGWDAAGETIEISHRARSREIFAGGAVTAAEWLVGRGEPATLEDMLNELLSPPG